MSSVLAVLLVSAFLLTGGAESAPSMPHLRSSERMIQGALADGVRLSPSFRRLVERLNDSDVIVHVVYDLRPRREIAAHVAFAADARGIRYLRIFVSPNLAGTDLVSILGHELEHAVEIADCPWVVNQRAMSTLYAAIGLPRDRYERDTFDTAAAIATGERIRRELLSDGVRAAASSPLRLR